MKFHIIEDNEYFLLIDKAPNIAFHQNKDGASLVERLRKQLNCPELYTVHRLDTITSGLLLFTKTKEVASEISSLFRHRKVEKKYLAISAKKPRKKQGWIIGDMKRSRRSGWILSRETTKPAVSYFLSKRVDGKSIFLIRTFTGKTHQVRVALKSVSAPILGDSLYGQAREDDDRCYLHAFSLRFKLYHKNYSFSTLPKQGKYFLSLEKQDLKEMEINLDKILKKASKKF